MKTKHLCVLGSLFFILSYLLFSNGSLRMQKPIDFAHWFNLIGACLLFFFNRAFPKNKLASIAAFITTLGVISHIGLCTIDFIMWSFGEDDISRNELRNHINHTPSILYPFIIVGPSLLFVGLSIHALNFIKTNPISALMVILGAPTIGFSFFVLQNGLFMLLGCTVFILGLTLLLFRKEISSRKIN